MNANLKSDVSVKKMKKESIIVEYLIITKQEDSFCDSASAFLTFLSVDSSITIKEEQKTITLSFLKKDVLTQFSVSYLLVSDLVPAKNERYFKLTLSSKDRENLNDYSKLTNVLEKNILKLNSEVSINILWNDIARQYAMDGYALINEVENLLRRLIASFMIINVGYYWAESHIPNEVSGRDERVKTNNYTDYLYQTYFSDLKTILFEGQREVNFRTIGDIQKIVEKSISSKKKEIPVEALRGVIAQSLWEKYFSKVASTKKEDLEKDLDDLNKLRNEIAHNRHVGRDVLGRIQNLSSRIIKTLNLAIEDLPNTKLTFEEQQFQSSAESTRIIQLNQGGKATLDAIKAEEAMVVWYSNKYPKAKIQWTALSNVDSGFEILVLMADDTYIGVQIKYVSVHSIRALRNRIAHTIEDSMHRNRNYSDAKEHHYVFVLQRYDSDDSAHYLSEIAGFVKEHNPKLVIIVGYLDEDKRFKQMV